MKKIPNIITGFRIACSITLLFVKPFSFIFFLLYIAGGMSDILDGFLARKMNITSKLGATLDSIADFLFIMVLLIIIFPYFDWTLWIICWIVAIIVIRLTSLLMGFLKYHDLAFLHTYGNKMTGFTLFCFPFMYLFWGLDITAILLCSIATLSAFEELIINIISKTLDKDISSVCLILRTKKS